MGQENKTLLVINCSKHDCASAIDGPSITLDPNADTVVCRSLEIKPGHSLSEEEKTQIVVKSEDSLQLYCLLYECKFYRKGFNCLGNLS